MSDKKLTVNDWQEFSIKKDLEKLNRLVKRTSVIGTTAIFDLSIAFLAVLFDRLFDNIDLSIRVTVYIVVAIVIIISLLTIFLQRGAIFLRRKSISVPSRELREYIDMFDNEIWCFVMMSDSFLDLLTNEHSADKHRKIFYYSETCFWLNKSIDKLSTMIHKLPGIFENDPNIITQNKKVSVSRLTNLLDIIYSIRKEAENQKLSLGISDEEASKLTSNDIYIKRLDQFISKANIDLKVAIERFRESN